MATLPKTFWTWLTVLALAVGTAAAAERRVPTPLSEHPGNIFLADEEAAVNLPAADQDAWQLVDYAGKVLREGKGSGKIALGKLPVGYYEVRRPQADPTKVVPVSLGVLARLKTPTPLTSPICCDVAMAWFYPKTKMADVARLSALAGLNWVRDRLSWVEIENPRGTFTKQTRYDISARAQAATGLQVLQVGHSTPAWAGANHKCFPPDLRDAYRFYRAIAKRWQDSVKAIEPWNEADIIGFGGHTGSEIATLQKVAYWGIKAGCPQTIVCQSVFALPRAVTLRDFQANQAWPYFETFNLHHYNRTADYPRVYAAYRAASAGRPLWATECNIPVMWTGDQGKAEPTETDTRIQAERMAKIFAGSLHEGSAATFFFILPHYVEGRKQFGIIRRDLTPRPAYVALAAVGRLLADAKPLGQLKTAGKAYAFLFRGKPDGQEAVTLVAWSDGDPTALPLPTAPTAVFDHLGREQSATTSTKSLSLVRAPQIALFDKDVATQFDVTPPPAAAPWLDGQPCPVVLQAVWPRGQVSESLSAYCVPPGQEAKIPVFVYNFGREAAAGRLAVTGPQGWKLTLPETVRVKPGERSELELRVAVPADAPKDSMTVAITGNFAAAGRNVLSLQLSPQVLPEKKK